MIVPLVHATSSRLRPASLPHHLRRHARAAPSLRISVRWERQSRPAPPCQPLVATRPSSRRSRSSAYYEKPITHPISLYLSTTPTTNDDHHQSTTLTLTRTRTITTDHTPRLSPLPHTSNTTSFIRYDKQADRQTNCGTTKTDWEECGLLLLQTTPPTPFRSPSCSGS